jgi:hypothetical protein
LEHLRQNLVIFALLFCSFLAAQEIKFVDLANIQQRTSLRFPPSKAVCSSDGHCVGGGSGGSSLACGAPDRRDPRELGVSLESLSTHDITQDPFEAEFRIVNTGTADIEIPVYPHLSDLQPADETQAFSYLSISIVVNLEGISQQAFGNGYIELYGASEKEGTTVFLHPGEWIRVKARMKLHTWPSQAVAARLIGDFWLRTNVYRPKEGGGFRGIRNIYPNHKLFVAIPVQFSPTRTQE